MEDQTEETGFLAYQIPCVYTWADLVVTPALEESLHDLCNLVRFQNFVGEQWGFYEKRLYGRGVCALFYGPSGTGKTMAAQVIARELEMALYRVDFSQIQSKYIGETQKNINILFTQAREINGILLFDEADALFSKRTEVKDANDRHSNGEIAYLLQKLEEYEGISILTTNLKNQMDEAFRRRIRRMIHFPLPDWETRKRLWKSVFPIQAPLAEEVKLERYAWKLELSAGEIKEAALDAALFAASEHEKIGDRHIQKALKLCCSKYGRILTEGDF